MRGTEVNSLMHFADWYATFCHLAGVDATDDVAIGNKLPDIDGVNQWPVLSGQTTKNQRSEIMVSPVTLIDWPWKLLTGPDPGSINSHGSHAGYVPFNVYDVGYYNRYWCKGDDAPDYCDRNHTGGA